MQLIIFLYSVHKSRDLTLLQGNLTFLIDRLKITHEIAYETALIYISLVKHGASMDSYVSR